MQNGANEPRKHTIAVLVENKFGVLSRVAGLFSARGYNIESLSVGETLDPTVSRMTLVVRGDHRLVADVRDPRGRADRQGRDRAWPQDAIAQGRGEVGQSRGGRSTAG